MTRILLGPFNRVEGDLEISLDVEAGQVARARVNSPLFRGFEQLLIGRSPQDALVIVPRICGICSVAQSAAAAAALADLARCEVAPNGILANRLIQATENLADHLTHFYLFFMPDFAHPAYAGMPWHESVVARFAAIKGSAAPATLLARANFLKLTGFLAGKWPHSLALQPGGNTKAMSTAERVRILALLRDFRNFLEKTLIGDVLEQFSALHSEAELLNWASGRDGDLPIFLRIAYSLSLEKVGCAGDRFLSYGAYGAFPSGVRKNMRIDRLLPEKITEDHRHAWMRDCAPLQPSKGETLVDAEKSEAYSWCKAPRYDGVPLETGALARQLLAQNPLLEDLVATHGGSVTARVVARMLELASVLPAMEQWVRQIVPGEPFCMQTSMPDIGEGVGMVEAARGSLGHWISVRQGRIERYQIIAPTTWNFSPRDENAQPGPLESALEGLPVGEGSQPTIQHVVRSFDPCMVCTVH